MALLAIILSLALSVCIPSSGGGSSNNESGGTWYLPGVLMKAKWSCTTNSVFSSFFLFPVFSTGIGSGRLRVTITGATTGAFCAAARAVWAVFIKARTTDRLFKTIFFVPTPPNTKPAANTLKMVTVLSTNTLTGMRVITKKATNNKVIRVNTAPEGFNQATRNPPRPWPTKPPTGTASPKKGSTLNCMVSREHSPIKNKIPEPRINNQLRKSFPRIKAQPKNAVITGKKNAPLPKTRASPSAK